MRSSCGVMVWLLSVLVPGAVGVLAQSSPPPARLNAESANVLDDTRLDASGMEKVELSETYDFLLNQFGSPGDRTPIRAMNVTPQGEVPDSSWFTNRIGIRNMSIAEITRGPNKFDPRDAARWDTWVVTEGKGPGGFQPGFRAERPGDPGQLYQLEIDPRGYPRLATGAEFIGTLIYHALGYHVQDTYVIKVDPKNVTIAKDATIRDASGRRPFTKRDLERILRKAATDDNGLIYMSAARYEEGEDLGHFEYHGRRSDDPNDVIPHEHRRELRANRVFAAWLAHDDSRAVNTRNIRVEKDGRKYVLHYMHDFGATLGSSTRYPEPVISNHQYYVEKNASLIALVTLGLKTPRPLKSQGPPDMPKSVGWFESATFDPREWKPNYPNPAFANMQPEDAVWAARLVARFSDGAIRAIVNSAGYDDQAAADYLARTLIERRDIIASTWLTGSARPPVSR